jgi:hypothetical protein
VDRDLLRRGLLEPIPPIRPLRAGSPSASRRSGGQARPPLPNQPTRDLTPTPKIFRLVPPAATRRQHG